jgi:hypothetical protein
MPVPTATIGWISRLLGAAFREERAIRRIHNRIERAREKQAIREDRDPPRRRKYIAWIYW